MITTGRYTIADLLEQPFDGTFYELIDGELQVFSTPNDVHAYAVLELVAWLREGQVAGYGQARTAPRAVVLDWYVHGTASRWAPQPDVFFVSTDPERVRGQFVKGPPDLVIEVLSATTRETDSLGGDKFGRYEQSGVPHYWLVDPDAQTVTQYVLEGESFVEQARLRPGDALVCPLFPLRPLPVAELFPAGAVYDDFPSSAM